MNITVQARTYATAAENMQVARQVRNQLFPPARPKPKPVAVQAAPVAIPATDLPEWRRVPCMFCHHVTQYYGRRLAELKPAQAHIRKRAHELGVTFRDLIGTSRKRRIVRHRQLLMWEIKTMINPAITMTELGNLFGGKDHSTAFHAIRTIQAMKDRGEID